MKVHVLSFQVELEESDPDPSGTIPQIAAAMFGQITARPLSSFEVRSMNVSTEGRRFFHVEAVGAETVV
jgi:hypothetical protein